MSEPELDIQSDAGEEAEALGVAQEVMGDEWGKAGTEAPETDVGGPGQASPPPAVSPAVAPLTIDQARQRWQQTNLTRAQLRQELESAHAQRQQYEDMANAILRAQQQQLAAQQPQQEDVPQIDPDLQRYFEAQQQNLLQQFQQMMAPALSLAQQQQAQQEIQQQVSAEQAQWNDFRDTVSQAEADYMATPEGQHYVDDMKGFEGALLDICSKSGFQPQMARTLVNEELKGVAMIAMATGQSPPIFMHNYINGLRAWAMGQGQQRAAAPRQQARVSPQVQIARQATMSGAVGAPPSNGSGGFGTSITAHDLVQRGLSAKDIDTLVKEKGSLDKAIKYLEQVGIDLDELEG